MFQVKLFRIFDKSKRDTLAKIINIFGKENIEILSNNVIAIRYDYSKRNIKQISRRLKNVEILQCIITNEVFYDLIQLALESGNYVQRIILTDEFILNEEFISRCLSKLNFDYDKLVYSKLINELEWCSNEEDVEIEKIEFRVQKDNRKVYVSVDNNGYIVGDDDILIDIKKIISKKVVQDI